ncbi:CPBP family intramembrane glutamic endopeptidase [Saccharopolyspora cebuensis]|uniref:Lysostaphin resistance A-like protein n=1 Tax=Saccharopolyspora cebuensis TaxID=418759 RepID=A0ABV4CCK5_9PSEU
MRRDLVLFLLVALGGAWLVAAPLWWSGAGLATPGFALVAAAMMFTPALGVLAVRLADRSTPARRWARDTGLGFGPSPKRTVGLLLAAYFGTPLLSALAVGISAAVGVLELDLAGFGLFTAQLEAAGVQPRGGAGALVAGQLVTMVLVAPALNAVLAFGEEWGWRGWLLPRLARHGVWPGLLLSGLIWGIWHAPVTALGYNYPHLGAWAAVLFTGFCVLCGLLLGWLRLRSGSVWPAVVGHGALNASAGLPLLLGSAEAPPNMALAGLVGLVGWAVLAVLAAVLLRSSPGGADVPVERGRLRSSA